MNFEWEQKSIQLMKLLFRSLSTLFSLLTVSLKLNLFQLKKDFTSDADSAVASLRGLSATKSSGRADLTLLFRAAAQEAKISRAQNRILRVVSLLFLTKPSPIATS